jgi:hypothetical protein
MGVRPVIRKVLFSANGLMEFLAFSIGRRGPSGSGWRWEPQPPTGGKRWPGGIPPWGAVLAVAALMALLGSATIVALNSGGSVGDGSVRAPTATATQQAVERFATPRPTKKPAPSSPMPSATPVESEPAAVLKVAQATLAAPALPALALNAALRAPQPSKPIAVTAAAPVPVMAPAAQVVPTTRIVVPGSSGAPLPTPTATPRPLSRAPLPTPTATPRPFSTPGTTASTSVSNKCLHSQAWLHASDTARQQANKNSAIFCVAQ